MVSSPFYRLRLSQDAASGVESESLRAGGGGVPAIRASAGPCWRGGPTGPGPRPAPQLPAAPRSPTVPPGVRHAGLATPALRRPEFPAPLPDPPPHACPIRIQGLGLWVPISRARLGLAFRGAVGVASGCVCSAHAQREVTDSLVCRDPRGGVRAREFGVAGHGEGESARGRLEERVTGVRGRRGQRRQGCVPDGRPRCGRRWSQRPASQRDAGWVRGGSSGRGLLGAHPRQAAKGTAEVGAKGERRQGERAGGRTSGVGALRCRSDPASCPPQSTCAFRLRRDLGLSLTSLPRGACLGKRVSETLSAGHVVDAGAGWGGAL